MRRRDPYTVARELEALVYALGEGANYRPLHETAAGLLDALELVRELRRAMVHRVASLNRTEDPDNA